MSKYIYRGESSIDLIREIRTVNTGEYIRFENNCTVVEDRAGFPLEEAMQLCKAAVAFTESPTNKEFKKLYRTAAFFNLARAKLKASTKANRLEAELNNG